MSLKIILSSIFIFLGYCTNKAAAFSGVLGLHIAVEVAIAVCILALLITVAVLTCYFCESCCFTKRRTLPRSGTRTRVSDSMQHAMVDNPLAYRKSRAEIQDNVMTQIRNISDKFEQLQDESDSVSHRPPVPLPRPSVETINPISNSRLSSQESTRSRVNQESPLNSMKDVSPAMPLTTETKLGLSKELKSDDHSYEDPQNSLNTLSKRPPMPIPAPKALSKTREKFRASCKPVTLRSRQLMIEREVVPLPAPLPPIPKPYAQSNRENSPGSGSKRDDMQLSSIHQSRRPAQPLPSIPVPKSPVPSSTSSVHSATKRYSGKNSQSNGPEELVSYTLPPADDPPPRTASSTPLTKGNVKKSTQPSLKRQNPLEGWTPSTVSLWLRSMGVGAFEGLSGISGSELARLSKSDLVLLGVHSNRIQDIIISSRDTLISESKGNKSNEIEPSEDIDHDEPYVTQDELRVPPVLPSLKRSQASVSDDRSTYVKQTQLNRSATQDSTMDQNGYDFLPDAEMNGLLELTHLSQYTALFSKEGIDDISTLCEYSEDELKRLGVKGGHAKRLLSEAKSLHPETRLNPSRMARELESSERVLREHVQRLQTVSLQKFKPDGIPWEIERESLFEGKFLGEGSFGEVYFGTADNLLSHESETLVAIKKLKSTASELDKRDFLDEIHVMQQFGTHPNLVNLLGFCIKSEPMLLIVEYMKDGDMLSFLRDSRPSADDPEPRVKAKELLGYMADIAAGMAFISKHRCVHRDLAARNILLDRPRAAVADFGLARRMTEQYAYLIQNQQRALPTRWLAPESLLYQKFTTQTDVWALGVTIWEIVTMGAIPYPGIQSIQLFQLLHSGYRMSKPQNCSDELYQLILQCWHKTPSKRPSFVDIENKFREMAQQPSTHLFESTEGIQEWLSFEESENCSGDVTTAAMFANSNQQVDTNSTMSINCDLSSEVTQTNTACEPRLSGSWRNLIKKKTTFDFDYSEGADDTQQRATYAFHDPNKTSFISCQDDYASTTDYNRESSQLITNSSNATDDIVIVEGDGAQVGSNAATTNQYDDLSPRQLSSPTEANAEKMISKSEDDNTGKTVVSDPSTKTDSFHFNNECSSSYRSSSQFQGHCAELNHGNTFSPVSQESDVSDSLPTLATNEKSNDQEKRQKQQRQGQKQNEEQGGQSHQQQQQQQQQQTSQTQRTSIAHPADADNIYSFENTADPFKHSQESSLPWSSNTVHGTHFEAKQQFVNNTTDNVLSDKLEIQGEGFEENQFEQKDKTDSVSSFLKIDHNSDGIDLDAIAEAAIAYPYCTENELTYENPMNFPGSNDITGNTGSNDAKNVANNFDFGTPLISTDVTVADIAPIYIDVGSERESDLYETIHQTSVPPLTFDDLQRMNDTSTEYLLESPVQPTIDSLPKDHRYLELHTDEPSTVVCSRDKISKLQRKPTQQDREQHMKDQKLKLLQKQLQEMKELQEQIQKEMNEMRHVEEEKQSEPSLQHQKRQQQLELVQRQQRLELQQHTHNVNQFSGLDEDAPYSILPPAPVGILQSNDPTSSTKSDHAEDDYAPERPSKPNHLIASANIDLGDSSIPPPLPTKQSRIK